jgi:uncharacterized protein YbjQ (UPF0145 family)
MEEEAKRHGAIGIAGVTSELKTLAGYMEFLSQGTSVSGNLAQNSQFFSTAASGIELYCHLDAGYQPRKFVMGNICYSLGIGRSFMGGLRTLARGEVHEYSQMYNHIRHLALERIKHEAAVVGANAVVDIGVQMLPFLGVVELLMTGTASHHDGIVMRDARDVVTSELEGPELWNLAKIGLVPVQLVMTTSVVSLGLAAGIGTLFQSLARGELPEVTKLVYDSRENCLDMMRKEAQSLGADAVVGNRLMISEISPGLIEVVALGTAVRRVDNSVFQPRTPDLPPQAVIRENTGLTGSVGHGTTVPALQGGGVQMMGGAKVGVQPQAALLGCVVMISMTVIGIIGAIIAALANSH